MNFIYNDDIEKKNHFNNRKKIKISSITVSLICFMKEKKYYNNE